MPKLKIFIAPAQAYSQPIRYTLGLMSNSTGFTFGFVDAASEADFIYDHHRPESLPVEFDYWQAIADLNWQKAREMFLSNADLNSLSAIFHLSNCIQEYDSTYIDPYGRYQYMASWQCKTSNIESNVVQAGIFSYLERFMHVKGVNDTPSKIFLSHDIDTIHGAFLQDGFAALKSGRIDLLAALVYQFLAGKADWINMDVINKMHDDYGIKHSYFWIVNQIRAHEIKNADYSLAELKKHSSTCHSNGLHKSSSFSTHKEELAMLPFNSHSNRNHFLRFVLPIHWEELAASGLKVDCSLGFAEHFGFRNSYGFPFRPYDPKRKTAYPFIEVPLQVMDSTFRNYMQIPTHETADTIIRFLEKNSNHCILSILWHNTFFTNVKYKGYRAEYAKILAYLMEKKLETLDLYDLERIELQ
ncbi:MAG: hypothetical protein IPN29_00150 [Saprospiraceae bacterium]|nr:hypothetical protein [Saprospiraceae bacterium]